MALSRWDTFSTTVRDATWAEFKGAFREHHVPLGIVQLKEEQFRESSQSSVCNQKVCYIKNIYEKCSTKIFGVFSKGVKNCLNITFTIAG